MPHAAFHRPRVRGRDDTEKIGADTFIKTDCHPGHVAMFYGMLNYHEPGSPTSCSSLG